MSKIIRIIFVIMGTIAGVIGLISAFLPGGIFYS